MGNHHDEAGVWLTGEPQLPVGTDLVTFAVDDDVGTGGADRHGNPVLGGRRDARGCRAGTLEGLISWRGLAQQEEGAGGCAGYRRHCEPYLQARTRPLRSRALRPVELHRRC